MPTCVVYFDISKAFDTVTHPKLIIQKLAAYGFEGNILSFISDFVVGRSQRVVLPNGVSSWRSLDYIVEYWSSTGSVLCPLLFLLYINDITSMFTNNVSIKIFADD